jgi:hypothetical protein
MLFGLFVGGGRAIRGYETCLDGDRHWSVSHVGTNQKNRYPHDASQPLSMFRSQIHRRDTYLHICPSRCLLVCVNKGIAKGSRCGHKRKQSTGDQPGEVTNREIWRGMDATNPNGPQRDEKFVVRRATRQPRPGPYYLCIHRKAIIALHMGDGSKSDATQILRLPPDFLHQTPPTATLMTLPEPGTFLRHHNDRYGCAGHNAGVAGPRRVAGPVREVRKTLRLPPATVNNRPSAVFSPNHDDCIHDRVYLVRDRHGNRMVVQYRSPICFSQIMEVHCDAVSGPPSA